MAAFSSNKLVGLANSLPRPLKTFLARYPPPTLLGAPAKGAVGEAAVAAELPKTSYQIDRPHPFRFWKNPATGKWQDPVYSLRRQADLVKMAKTHGVEELLPETIKGSEYKLARRVEHGLRVKGTGVGQRVKGHAHERHMLSKYVFRGGALLLLVMSVLVTDANTLGTGCRRGERPCWRCPTSSEAGRG
jgi:large subunit ribosomal protein L25